MTADLAAADIGTLDPALLEAAARGATRMLPACAYTSDEVLAWERRHLFAGTWTCVGREGDLRSGGANQRAVGVGDVSVLLTWEATADEGPAAMFSAQRRNHHGRIALCA